jgi:hypothetical protein
LYVRGELPCLGRACGRRAPRIPRIEAARRDRARPKQGAKRELGLVCHHEFEEFEELSSLFLAIQAVAFAKMSRGILSCRFSRRPPGEFPAFGAYEPFLPRQGFARIPGAWASGLMIL